MKQRVNSRNTLGWSPLFPMQNPRDGCLSRVGVHDGTLYTNPRIRFHPYWLRYCCRYVGWRLAERLVNLYVLSFVTQESSRSEFGISFLGLTVWVTLPRCRPLNPNEIFNRASAKILAKG